MILEFDVGNSRIKWRLIEADTLAVCGEGHVSDFVELQCVPEFEASIEFVRMCSVRDPQVNLSIENWVRESFGVELQRAQVTRSCGGVRNQYKDLNRLGIDRWLAMLAAYNRAGGACMVIDSGTAFTLDVVDEQGLHLGGYIIPGLRLMRSSLEANTAIRLSQDYGSVSRELGHSTDEAVFNGTATALLAAINEQAQSLQGTGPGLKTYFAGGDAELLHRLAGIQSSEVVLSLVLDGLNIVCPWSAQKDGRA